MFVAVVWWEDGMTVVTSETVEGMFIDLAGTLIADQESYSYGIARDGFEEKLSEFKLMENIEDFEELADSFEKFIGPLGGVYPSKVYIKSR